MRRFVKLLLLFPLFAAFPVPMALSADALTRDGFAVVELFTSEGCSSCPPADDALSMLVREADRQKLPIYALEWHVDYWDYLGWKDPWDSRFATERQYAYAQSLPSSVYTPQVVINGQFVADSAEDLRELETLASSAAAQPAKAMIRLSAVHQESPTSVRVSLEVAGAPRGSTVLLAEVEGDLRATPNAGENASRSLVHSNVVRVAKFFPAVRGSAALNVPPAVAGTTRRMIALLEDSSTLRILAATQVRLSAAGGDELSGRVLDSSGRPVPGALIRACSATSCIPARTDNEGYFALQGMHAGNYEIDFGLPASVARHGMSTATGSALASPVMASVQFLYRPRGVFITTTVWRYLPEDR